MSEFKWADLPPIDMSRATLVYKFPMENKVIDARGRLHEYLAIDGRLVWFPLGFASIGQKQMIEMKSKIINHRSKRDELQRKII